MAFQQLPLPLPVASLPLTSSQNAQPYLGTAVPRREERDGSIGLVGENSPNSFAALLFVQSGIKKKKSDSKMAEGEAGGKRGGRVMGWRWKEKRGSDNLLWGK